MCKHKCLDGGGGGGGGWGGAPRVPESENNTLLPLTRTNDLAKILEQSALVFKSYHPETLMAEKIKNPTNL